MYTKMPKFIGISENQETMIRWDDLATVSKCKFSIVVLCSRIPPSMPMANSPCLSHLFGEEITTNNDCHVTRSVDRQSGVTEIASGIWLFYGVQSMQFYQMHTIADNTVDIITIRNEVIIQMRCDRKIICFGNQLPITPCAKRRLVLLPNMRDHIPDENKNFQISTQNTTNRLLSAFSEQNVRFYQDVVTDYTKHQSFFKQMLHEIGYTIFAIITTSFLVIVAYILKCVRRQFQSELGTLHEIVHDMSIV